MERRGRCSHASSRTRSLIGLNTGIGNGVFGRRFRMGVRLGPHMDQEAPFDAHDESECQRRLAGYSAQVAAHVALRQGLLKVQFGVKIQFGHDNKPVI